MTRPELIRWANAPEQRDNIVAEAVRELIGLYDYAVKQHVDLLLEYRNAQAALGNYETECARLRKAALPQAPWESEDHYEAQDTLQRHPANAVRVPRVGADAGPDCDPRRGPDQPAIERVDGVELDEEKRPRAETGAVASEWRVRDVVGGDLMRLLDLFCGPGGCSVGYNRAGFDIVGIDIKPQPSYPFEFVHRPTRNS